MNFEIVTAKQLYEAQIKNLITGIKEKNCCKRLFNVYVNELSNAKETSKWLNKGNLKPRDEVSSCFLQDRNIFFGEKSDYPHFKRA